MSERKSKSSQAKVEVEAEAQTKGEPKPRIAGRSKAAGKTRRPTKMDGERPTNREEIRRWLEQYTGLKLTDQAVCPGHNAPLDYLEHSFLEGGSDVVVWAPRGGGKTTLGAAATLMDLVFKPGCQVRILGGSLDQSLRMWESLWPWWTRLHQQVATKRTKDKVVIMKNDARVGVLTQSERSVRGIRVQKLRCDEVELFNPDVWEAAQLVTRSITCNGRAVRGVVEAFSTMHRPHGRVRKRIDTAKDTGKPVIHWCILEVLEKCPVERECAHCLLQVDCGGIAKEKCNGHVGIDDAIAMKHRVSRETWESEMLCKRPSSRNCVFANFSEEIHVREFAPLDPGSTKLWLGVDFGFQNPFVCLWIRADERGVAHVIDEYVQEHKQMHEHVATIQARPHGRVYRLACDPAGKSRNDQTSKSNIQLLRDAGFAVRHRGSAILDGVEKIRAALAPAAGEPSLFVHPRCKRLIEALAEYRYSEEDDEVPLKDGRHDHLTDALRYFYVNWTRGDVRESGY